ncbi:MAG: hypothetical protein NVS4B3_08510 [Gemmatimonadaceae bacterium]
MLRRSVLPLAASLLVAVPIAAQDVGRIEVGTMASATAFDGGSGFANQGIFGARMGFLVGSGAAHVFIEGDGIEAQQWVAGTHVDYTAVRARALYSSWLGYGMSALYGVGITRNHIASRPYEFGFSPIVGVRAAIAPYVALRVDGWMDYLPKATNQFGATSSAARYGIQAGLSFPLWGASLNGPPQLAQAPDAPAPVVVAAKPVIAPQPVVDSDGDGVPDTIDRCPNTPKWVVVDRFGCPLAPPTPPTPPAAVVVEAPRPVVAPIARCATPPAGTKVDADGCRILFERNETTLTLRGVRFLSGRAQLLSSSRTALDTVALALLAHPDVQIEIAGHTDSRGKLAKNRRISQQRADAVLSYLALRGVPFERMTAKGYGSTQPIASNKTRLGREKNRRVELRKIS